jgi:hypothetical protein
MAYAHLQSIPLLTGTRCVRISLHPFLPSDHNVIVGGWVFVVLLIVKER